MDTRVVITVVMLSAAILLSIVSVATNWWSYETGIADFNTGLFKTCLEGICYKSPNTKGYVEATAALMISAIVFQFVSVLSLLFGVIKKQVAPVRIAILTSAVSALLLVTGGAVYTGHSENAVLVASYGYSYFLCWAASLLILLASVFGAATMAHLQQTFFRTLSPL